MVGSCELRVQWIRDRKGGSRIDEKTVAVSPGPEDPGWKRRDAR
jgi:hypothetical protein